MRSRRAYLALLTGGLTALAGCQALDRSGPSTPDGETPTPGRRTGTDTSEDGTATPTEFVPESSFGRVVDLVEDAGVDPTGEEPVDGAFDSAMADDTLLVFPEGRYKFQGAHTIANHDRIGIVGRGDTTIVPNDVWNGKLFDVTYVSEFLFEGFDVDLSHENTTVGFRVAVDHRFRVEDLRFVGRGNHPNESVIHAMNAGVVNEDGKGLIRNMVAKQGSAVDEYKNGGGRGGIYVGPWNKGTIDIEECHLAEFGNNGIYASRTPGNVRVRGGTFRNNSPSSVRIGGEGSLLEDALIEADLGKYTGPQISSNDFKMRGVVIEQKTEVDDLLKPAGAVMRGCEVIHRNNPTKGPPVVVWSNGKTLTIENCRIHVENDTPAVLREGLEKQGTNPAWQGDRWVRISDTEITGANAPGYTAVKLIDAPGSQLRNCRVERTGRRCTGIEIIRSDDALIEGGAIRTSGYPVVIDVDSRRDGCLVSFADRPDLEMLGSRRGSGHRREVSGCGTGAGDPDSSTDDSACCIEWGDLPEIASSDASHIGVSGLEGRDVTFHSVRRGG